MAGIWAMVQVAHEGVDSSRFLWFRLQDLGFMGFCIRGCGCGDHVREVKT